MSEEDDLKKAHKQIADSAPVFLQMGRLASDWALLELAINECIWKLANVAPVLGACITAQIFTINNRLFALMALLRLRGFDEELVKKINGFADDLRGPAEKRNRVIHDPIFVSPELNKVGRLEITAQRKPVFEMKEVSVQTLKEARLEINACLNTFMDYRAVIFETLPTLPEIPASSPLPINLTLVVQKQSPTSEKK